ncbi:MAG: DNA polymerase IV, partial [Firmicutes bacterium]|nr:DNA polymerase IV [Bacillota bacterium]
VSMRLRSHGLRCKGVKVDIKNPQFVTISRQTQLSYATDLSSDLFRAVMELFAENWYYGNPIRLITVTAINLTQDAEAESAQLSIFDGEEGASYDERQKHLETAVDHIRSRFGKNSIIKGGLVHNDLGIVIDKE